MGVVVRVYNIGSEPVEARVRLALPFARVERVDLNEEMPEAVDIEDGVVRLGLRSNEIASLRFKR